jgi:hypothetical protein
MPPPILDPIRYSHKVAAAMELPGHRKQHWAVNIVIGIGIEVAYIHDNRSSRRTKLGTRAAMQGMQKLKYLDVYSIHNLIHSALQLRS